MNRAPRGHTYEPCHGCGSTELHKKDNLCWECSNALESFRQMLARHGDSSKVFRRIPTYRGDMPYLPHDYPPGEIHTADRVTEHLFNLATALTEPSESQCAESLFPAPPGPVVNSRYAGTSTVAINVKVAELLTKLHLAIHATVRRAHAEGHAEGRSLLARLAGGQMTADEFNDQALRREGGSK